MLKSSLFLLLALLTGCQKLLPFENRGQDRWPTLGDRSSTDLATADFAIRDRSPLDLTRVDRSPDAQRDWIDNLGICANKAGQVITLAGNGAVGKAIDVPVQQATFNYPTGVAVDSQMRVLVADGWNGRVVRFEENLASSVAAVNSGYFFTDVIWASNSKFVFSEGASGYRVTSRELPSGPLVVLAGGYGCGCQDGLQGVASFKDPRGLALGSSNDIYVADAGCQSIRRIYTDSTQHIAVESVGGTFSRPMGVVMTPQGDLYVADSGNHQVWQLSRNGTVSFAGSATAGAADGYGAAAQFNGPQGLAYDGNKLYVADTGNNRIRLIDLTSRAVTTLAGGSTAGGFADGPALQATFQQPSDVAVDSKGRVFIADAANYSIRLICPQ